MAFKITKDKLKQSVMCPVGTHLMTLIEVEDEYISAKGTNVQPALFETDSGYQIKTWFNDAVMRQLIEFVEAADNIKFNMEKMEDVSINLKEYVGKRVAGVVSPGTDKNGKPVVQIDNFYSAEKVPF
jgi:hypothetical protein